MITYVVHWEFNDGTDKSETYQDKIKAIDLMKSLINDNPDTLEDVTITKREILYGGMSIDREEIYHWNKEWADFLSSVSESLKKAEKVRRQRNSKVRHQRNSVYRFNVEDYDGFGVPASELINALTSYIEEYGDLPVVGMNCSCGRMEEFTHGIDEINNGQPVICLYLN